MTATALLRTSLRMQTSSVNVSVTDLLTVAVKWATAWAVDGTANDPGAINDDVALAQEAMATPISSDGWAYLTLAQLKASQRLLEDAQEYAQVNDYFSEGENAAERLLGDLDLQRLLDIWPA